MFIYTRKGIKTILVSHNRTLTTQDARYHILYGNGIVNLKLYFVVLCWGFGFVIMISSFEERVSIDEKTF